MISISNIYDFLIDASLAHEKSCKHLLFLLFLHSVIFIDWMYCDRRGSENPRLSVCLSVFQCVCPYAPEHQNYWPDVNQTYPNGSPNGLVVRVCDLAHYHI